MLGLGSRTAFRRGASLALEGDPADHCFKLLRGVVLVYTLLPNGQRQVIDVLVAGDIFGFSDGTAYAFSAQAVGPVVALRYSRQSVETAARSDPALAHWLFTAMSRSLIAARLQIVMLGSKKAQEKVAAFLLLFARRQQRSGVADEPLRLPLRRRDIADYLGVTTETVSRAFTRLKETGAIELRHPDEVTFRDRHALERLAGGCAGSD